MELGIANGFPCPMRQHIPDSDSRLWPKWWHKCAGEPPFPFEILIWIMVGTLHLRVCFCSSGKSGCHLNHLSKHQVLAMYWICVMQCTVKSGMFFRVNHNYLLCIIWFWKWRKRNQVKIHIAYFARWKPDGFADWMLQWNESTSTSNSPGMTPVFLKLTLSVCMAWHVNFYLVMRLHLWCAYPFLAVAVGESDSSHESVQFHQ